MSYSIGQRVRYVHNPKYAIAGDVPQGAEGFIVNGPLPCDVLNGDSGLRYLVKFDCGIERLRIHEVLVPIDSDDNRQTIAWDKCVWRPIAISNAVSEGEQHVD